MVTAAADALISRVVPEAGGELLIQTQPGYGGALLTGFSRARGRYVLTMDADVAGRPTVVQDLWAARETADVVIASRYIQGGHARMPRGRSALSRTVNWLSARALNIPIRDLSSGFRLYRGSVLRGQSHTARDFDILQQIIVRAYADGWKVGKFLSRTSRGAMAARTRAFSGSAGLFSAASDRCGCCAIRSLPPIMTIALTTAASTCSDTGSGCATGTSPN